MLMYTAQAVVICLTVVNGAPAQLVSVRTQHNDRARTGVSDTETVLTRDKVRSSVAANKFGRVSRLSVKGQISAQPLYLNAVRIGGATREVVFVATMHNNVYAFDANDYSQLWARNFGCQVPFDASPLFWDVFGYNIHDAVGILGTPTIDDAGEFMYFITRVDRNATGGNSDPELSRCTTAGQLDVRFEVHKVDVVSGLDAVPPRRIEASVSPKTVLDPLRHLQRPGLLFANGSLYVAFGGYQDTPRWNGWILRFAGSDLTVEATFCVAPTGSGGGIWQAGSGLAANAAGNIYFMSGNGTSNPRQTPPNLGTAFGELSPSLEVLSYFIPKNHFWLNLFDVDLGSSGPVLLPDGDVIGGGKQGRLYALRPMASTTRTFVVRDEEQVTPRFGWPFIPPFSSRHIHGAPVVWSRQGDEAWVFVWGERDRLKRYTYAHTAAVASFKDKKTSGLAAPRMGMPGGTLSLTVNGTDRGSAVLWASLPHHDDAFTKDVAGILRAIDPETLTELWNNESEAYLYAKYCPPTIANGKVFLATFSGWLDVYGLKP
jgi:outer membrane protein assembly factor BamB